MGCLPKARKNAKVEPEIPESPEPAESPEPYSPALIRHVEKMIEKEKAKKRKSIRSQTRPSFLLRLARRSGTPCWMNYDVDMKGRVVKDGIQIKCPAKLEKDETLPVLTLEMLLDKQEKAERKREELLEKKRNGRIKIVSELCQKQVEREQEAKRDAMIEMQRIKQARAAQKRKEFLDERRKAARLKDKSQEFKAREEVDALQRQAIIMKLTLKQQRAEANRKEQLQLVKARAIDSLYDTKNKIVEAKRKAKARLTKRKNEQKMKRAEQNKTRMVNRVVFKQHLIDMHGNQVRRRLEQQRREEEEVYEFDLEWNKIESDEHYQRDSDDEYTKW